MSQEVSVTVYDPEADKTITLVDNSKTVVIEDPSAGAQVLIEGLETLVSISGTDATVSIVENPTTVIIQNQDNKVSNTQIEEKIVVVEESSVEIISIGMQGPRGPASNPNESFEFVLDSDLLDYEISPGILRVPLPLTKTLVGATGVQAFIDGIRQKSGYGWQVASDGLAIEIYVPTDSGLRTKYLEADLGYYITWIS